jgi:hypothetical protein
MFSVLFCSAQSNLNAAAKIPRLGQARSEPLFAVARPTTAVQLAFGGAHSNRAL